jgi:hypothetical protein
MTVVRKLWSGQYSLPVAFWLFYCAGMVACPIVAGTILFLSRTINARPVAFIVGFAFVNGYLLTVSVGVWRSATPFATSPIWMQRFWAAAARFVVIIGIARLVLGLMNGGAVALMQQVTGHMEF